MSKASGTRPVNVRERFAGEGDQESCPGGARGFRRLAERVAKWHVHGVVANEALWKLLQSMSEMAAEEEGDACEGPSVRTGVE